MPCHLRVQHFKKALIMCLDRQKILEILVSEPPTPTDTFYYIAGKLISF